MNFCERLAMERKRLGFRQPEFAEKCGVKGPTQSLYETGKRYPDADYLIRACELGADPAFLLTGTPSHPSTLQVAEPDKAPLAAFHGLSPKVRAAMMALLDAAKSEG
jgi:transcriptional regulator with XRE-family HTH domain